MLKGSGKVLCHPGTNFQIRVMGNQISLPGYLAFRTSRSMYVVPDANAVAPIQEVRSIKATIESGRQVYGPCLTTVPVFSSPAFFEFDQTSLGVIPCVLLPADLPEQS